MIPEREWPLATSRRSFLVGAAAALAGTPLWAQDSAAGKVESLRGLAFAVRTDARRSLQPAADVFVGDLVETDASSGVIMRLGKSTTVKLGSGARFRIDKFVIDAGGTLDLEQGALVIETHGPRKESLRVRSPFGLIAVRGTIFFAGPSNGVFGVFVRRGAVRVTGAGKTVRLGAGLGTDIAKPGAAPTAPKAWGEARITAALASVG
jgi:ferric-dicitrate binding protein FerR (iron transport regulator)